MIVFKDIAVGDYFMYNGVKYVKTTLVRVLGIPRANAYNTNTAAYELFQDNTEVIPV